jgi:NADH-quinone oxidoreductase subunit N
MNIAFQIEDLWGILPAIVLCAFGGIAALAEVFADRSASRSFVAGLGGFGVLIALGVNCWQWAGIEGAFSVPLFGGALVMDAFSTFFNFAFLAAAGLALLLGAGYLRQHDADQGEYTSLVLFGATGMMLMAQSRDLIVFFIALELMSIAVYVLTAFVRKSRRGAESALKYFLIGSFASAILLYGAALLYGATGTTDATAMRPIFDADPALKSSMLVQLGMLFLLVGLGFKVAMAPFHLWTPDVYEGAPSPVTAFMAAGVKAAGFAALIRIFTVTFGYDALEFGDSGNGWVGVLYGLAIVTMFAGNLGALPQTNIKRMLAYSSISHAGYLLIGLVASAFGDLSNASSIDQAVGPGSTIALYLLAYTFSTFLVFGGLSLLGKDGEEYTNLSDLAGLGFKRPFVGVAITLGLLSLAGIPPLGGFFAKFYLFREAMTLGRPELTILVLIAAVNSMIALYYYLRVIVFLYMKEPTREVPVFESRGVTVALALSLTATVALGVMPSRAVDMARRSMASLGSTEARAAAQAPNTTQTADTIKAAAVKALDGAATRLRKAAPAPAAE